jgi:hypothetical protein
MNWFQHYWWVVLTVILILPLFAIAAFARWLSRKPNIGLEEAVKCWDVFVKLISALTIIVSGAILIGKYVDQREQTERQSRAQEQKESNLRSAEFLRQKLAFDTELHQRRRKLFDEVKLLAARLSNGGKRTEADVRRFSELYYADLIGIEQLRGPVESAMVTFRMKLQQEHGAPEDSLDQLALKLARACETEMSASLEKLLAQHQAIAALVTAETGR